MKSRPVAAVLVACALLLGGCGRAGLNDLPLPGTEGVKPGSYELKLEMPSVGNLVPNNPVKLNDIDVGVIRGIDLDGWHAVVTVSINPDVKLPKNVTARVGQSSLLGAKYIELTQPAGTPGGNPLQPGATLPLSQTGRYPETEDTLAAVAALLNGGGLQHVKTISTELNRAMSGRTPQYRDLLTQVNTFTAGLDAQKVDIVKAIDGLDRLGSGFAAQDATLRDALVAVPPALDVLNQERANLTDALVALGDFGTQADRVFSETDDNLARNLRDLDPALKGLADSGKSLSESLWVGGTLLFPLKTFPYMFRGDYINFWVTVDLSLPTLDRNFLSGTPAEGSLGKLQKQMAAITGGSQGATNPLLAPLQPPTDKGSSNKKVPSEGEIMLPGSGGLSTLTPGGGQN